MNCKNKKCACTNEVEYIESIKCGDFCSIECYVMYTGREKPSGRRGFYRIPPPDEWIVKLGIGSTYIWDDFQKQYFRYVLGRGIFSDLGELLADEWSDYYWMVIDRINEVQCNPILADFEPVDNPKRKRGVKKSSKRGKYKSKNKKVREYICKGCGGKFTTISNRKEFHRESCRRKYWRRKKAEKELNDKMNSQY